MRLAFLPSDLNGLKTWLSLLSPHGKFHKVMDRTSFSDVNKLLMALLMKAPTSLELWMDVKYALICTLD
jgi:hypothetical protein